MLVLTRDSNEGTNVVIITTPEGRTIKVMVTWINNRRVSLGFEAAKEIVINRGEVNGTFRRKEG